MFKINPDNFPFPQAIVYFQFSTPAGYAINCEPKRDFNFLVRTSCMLLKLAPILLLIDLYNARQAPGNSLAI